MSQLPQSDMFKSCCPFMVTKPESFLKPNLKFDTIFYTKTSPTKTINSNLKEIRLKKLFFQDKNNIFIISFIHCHVGGNQNLNLQQFK